MISADLLVATIGCSRERAELFVVPIRDAMAQFRLVTPAQTALFLGNIAVESGRLEHLVENLNYTTASRIVQVWPSRFDLKTAQTYVKDPERLGNFVYAYRNGNGGVDSGDGFLYRGRGLIGITGKRNYAACGTAIGHNLVRMPELLELTEHAASSAAWYFATNVPQTAVERLDHRAVCKAINGGYQDLDLRAALSSKVLAALA